MHSLVTSTFIGMATKMLPSFHAINCCANSEDQRVAPTVPHLNSPLNMSVFTMWQVNLFPLLM